MSSELSQLLRELSTGVIRETGIILGDCKIIPSACHLTEKEWKPEPGSKEWLRWVETDFTRSYPNTHHILDLGSCPTKAAKERQHPEHLFTLIPADRRCRHCANWYAKNRPNG